MTRSHPAHQAQPDPALGADVVPGDPPVPVNVWRIPASDADAPVGARLAARLIAEYTRPKDLVYDHLPSPVLRKAAHAAGRCYRAASRFQAPTDRATLAVAGWPVTDRLDPVIVLGGLRRRLRPGGFLAVVVTNPAPAAGAQASAPVELAPLVATATAAELSYLQHLVTMPTVDRPPAAQDAGTAAAAPAATGGAMHERVHADVLVFCRPRSTGGSDA